MIVKLINHSKEVALESGFPQTKVFHCNRFEFMKGEIEEMAAIVIYENTNVASGLPICFDKSCHSVIVMNDNGDTIDSYSWSRDVGIKIK